VKKNQLSKSEVLSLIETNEGNVSASIDEVIGFLRDKKVKIGVKQDVSTVLGEKFRNIVSENDKLEAWNKIFSNRFPDQVTSILLNEILFSEDEGSDHLIVWALCNNKLKPSLMGQLSVLIKANREDSNKKERLKKILNGIIEYLFLLKKEELKPKMLLETFIKSLGIQDTKEVITKTLREKKPEEKEWIKNIFTNLKIVEKTQEKIFSAISFKETTRKKPSYEKKMYDYTYKLHRRSRRENPLSDEEKIEVIELLENLFKYNQGISLKILAVILNSLQSLKIEEIEMKPVIEKYEGFFITSLKEHIEKDQAQKKAIPKITLNQIIEFIYYFQLNKTQPFRQFVETNEKENKESQKTSKSERAFRKVLKHTIDKLNIDRTKIDILYNQYLNGRRPDTVIAIKDSEGKILQKIIIEYDGRLHFDDLWKINKSTRLRNGFYKKQKIPLFPMPSYAFKYENPNAGWERKRGAMIRKFFEGFLLKYLPRKEQDGY